MRKNKVFVISHARPQNVTKLSAIIGPGATWVVGHGEAQLYKRFGAESVTEGGGLCESRNLALHLAFASGMNCVQISDDLKKLQRVTLPEKTTKPLSFSMALLLMQDLMERNKARLAGVAPTSNAFFTNKEVQTKHFVVGDMIMVAPCDLRFDTNLKLKEDYDFTAQQIKAFGLVCRVDTILAHFEHRTNAGGAVDYRTSEREQAAISYLKAKWPDWIKDNARRPDEILFRPK